MLSVAKVGVAHVEYYTSTAAVGAPFAGPGGAHNPGAYYTDGGERPGMWAAPGAMGLGVGSPVTADQLKAVLAGMDPHQPDKPLGRRVNPAGTFVDQLGIVRQRKPVGGFDLTFSLPKSVSAAWALADEAVRREIEASWAAAVEAVIAYVQANAVASRSGAGGRTIEEVPDGATIARFDHFTSRAGDPLLHSHLVMANRVRCRDGVWRTLDGRLVYAGAKAASLVGGAVLRVEISRRLGWSWDRIDDRLHADLAGTPDKLIEAWSSRRRDVAKEAGRRIRRFEANTGKEPTAAQRLELWNQAAAASRKSKKLLPLEGDPWERWRAEAAELGLDAAAVVAAYSNVARADPGVYDRPELVISGPELIVSDQLVDRLVSAAEGEFTSLSDVDLDAIVHAAINASPGCARIGRDGDEIVAATARVLRERLERRLVHHRRRWWSPGLVAAEQAVAAWLASPAPPDEAASERLDLEGLGDDQQTALRHLVAATTRGGILIGPAGAGKTTTLARFAAAVGLGRVIAAAPTAVAAGTLGAAIGAPSSTVALINVSDAPIPKGGWVIVDEAGQLATRDLAILCGRAAAAEARVLMVGDPAQQGSVSSGGVFDALAAGGVLPTAALTQLWRFSDPAEAAATSMIHCGDRGGLAYHAEKGRITNSSYADSADAAADWWGRRRDKTTVISVPTLELMYGVNAEISARRVAAGETGRVVHGSDDRAVRIGDVVTSRKNDRRRRADDGSPIRNGDRWIVEGTAGGGDLILSHLDRQATVTVPAGYAAAHLNLGYAVTQTRAQSTTTDAAMTIITGSSSRDQLYVGLTRGSDENHLHIITDQPGMDPETAPKHTTASKVLKAVFARRHGWATASDVTAPVLDPHQAAAHLGRVAATGAGQSLPANGLINTADMIDNRNIIAQRVRASEIDAAISDGIDDWLAGLHEYDAHTARLQDQELAEMEDQLLATIEAIDPGADDPWDGFSPGNRIVPNTADTAAGPPAAGTDTPRPTLGAIRRARGLLDDDFRFLNAEAAAHVRHNNRQAAVAGDIDNPWLVHLWGDYQTADADGKAALTPILAAVADPAVGHRIAAVADCQPPTGPIADWAAQVRAAVADRRRRRHRDVIDHLASIRADAVARAGGGDRPALVAVDQQRWRTAVGEWLDGGCDPRHLATAWEQATLNTANDLWGQLTAPAQEPAGAEAGPAATIAPPLTLPQIAALAARPQPARQSRPANDADSGAEAVAKAAAWYHDQLLDSPDAADARSYLLSRGITEDLWSSWQLGWAPDQWQALTSHLSRTGTTLGDAVDAGVIGKTRGRYWDFLRGRVVFPIKDANGTAIALAGRILAGDGPKYLNTKNTGLYSKSSALFGLDQAADAIARTGEVVLVEGYTDAIACHAAGIANAIAACGTAFGPDHVHTLRNDAGQPGLLTIALDGDAAGAQAAAAAADIAAECELAHRTAHLPDGTDPAELEPDELRHIIQSARPQPWSHLPALAAASSIAARVKAGYAAAGQAGRHSDIAALLAAHEIAIAADLDFQTLLDIAADPARTAGRPPPQRRRAASLTL